jgi:ligand-binding sensor domain-containing protein
MYQRFLFIILAAFLWNPLWSQIRVGEWREHLPYNQLIGVADGNNNIVYAATPYSIFSLDKSEFSIERLSKVNGLTDANLNTINFHKPTQTLMIGYKSGNIDLLRDGKVTNVSDIKRKNIIGGKQINNIYFNGDLGYICTKFGIVVYDMEAREIKDTWYIGPDGSSLEVLDFEQNDTAFFAATAAGLYTAPLTGVNHAFYANWTKYTDLPHPDGRINTFCLHQGKIYVNSSNHAWGEDTIFVRDNNGWDYFDKTKSGPNHQLKSTGDTLILVGGIVQYYYNNLNDDFLIYAYSQSNFASSAIDAYFDDQNRLWIADQRQGLVLSKMPWHYKEILPEGPAYINGYSMDCQNEMLWVTSGGVKENWDNNYEGKGIYTFQDQGWTSYNKTNVDAFDTIHDVLSVAIHPSTSNKVYVGTWGKGLLEFEDGVLTKIWDTTNSTLSDASNRPGFVGVAGLKFDQDNNLWVTNSANSQGLSVLTVDQKWHKFSLTPYVTENVVGQLTIDHWGQKWIILPHGSGGLLVFHEGEDFEDPSDDQVARLNTAIGQGALPSNKVLSVAVDRDNEIWIGTTKGVAVVYNPGQVFQQNGNYDAQQIYVEQAGISQYLLESEEVTAIAVDGANNKWFGTKNAGVFYMSADGTEQIYHFTEENSALLDNHVMSICIDHKSGEVFFGTESGIVSFRGSATRGSENHNDIHVFPNPVRQNYDGYITVSGLVEDAFVKITDVAGNLVHETQALGGQAVWNGYNINGEKVATGVYLVFSTNNDGTETEVTKIMFIR